MAEEENNGFRSSVTDQVISRFPSPSKTVLGPGFESRKSFTQRFQDSPPKTPGPGEYETNVPERTVTNTGGALTRETPVFARSVIRAEAQEALRSRSHAYMEKPEDVGPDTYNAERGERYLNPTRTLVNTKSRKTLMDRLQKSDDMSGPREFRRTLLKTGYAGRPTEVVDSTFVANNPESKYRSTPTTNFAEVITRQKREPRAPETVTQEEWRDHPDRFVRKVTVHRSPPKSPRVVHDSFGRQLLSQKKTNRSFTIGGIGQNHSRIPLT